MVFRYSIFTFTAEGFKDAAHYVHNTYGVLKTAVSGTGIHHIRQTKLLNPSESLESGSVNKFGF